MNAGVQKALWVNSTHLSAYSSVGRVHVLESSKPEFKCSHSHLKGHYKNSFDLYF